MKDADVVREAVDRIWRELPPSAGLYDFSVALLEWDRSRAKPVQIEGSDGFCADPECQ